MFFCLTRPTAGKGLTFEEFAKLAADSGYGGADVELPWAVQHGANALADLFARLKLRYGAWGAPDWRNADPAKAADALAALPAQAAIARQLNIDSCITWIMPSSDRPFIENWNWHVQRLQSVARVLADHGLRFGLEFVAPFHARRAYKHEFIFTPGQMLELADAVGPNAGLLVDLFHCRSAGESWEHVAQLPGSRIVVAHLNDAPDVPIHQLQDGARLLPGQGVGDAAPFLRALKQAGFEGPVGVEVFSAELKAMTASDAASAAWKATQRVAEGLA